MRGTNHNLNRLLDKPGLMAADLKALYQQFGIDIEDYNGDASWTLPLPARMIIDTDGIIRYASISTDYTVRPDPEDTIAALQRIV